VPKLPHIVLITSSYPYQGEGGLTAGPFAEDFARELAQHTRVTVLAAGPQDNLTHDDNLTVRHFSVPKFPLSQLKLSNPRDWPGILKSVQAGQQILDSVLKNTQIDFVLACWAFPAGFWAMRSSRKHHVSYAVWALGSDILVLGKVPFVRWLLRKILRQADICFADGYSLTQEVENLASVPCSFLPSSRKLPELPGKHLRNRPPFRFAYLGRWHPIKGVDLLLEALAILEDADWDRIEGVKICGGGPLESEVHKTCETLQAKNRPVEFTDYLDKQQVSKMFFWADYLLIPSRSESIPVVFSEAMSNLCPIICTPAGDLPKLIAQYGVGIQAPDMTSSGIKISMQEALSKSPAEFIAGMETARRDFDVVHSTSKFLSAISHGDLI